MNERQVLVISGNFEIVQQVRQALKGRGFKVQSAYSHSDAAYSVRQGRHDVMLVDGTMCDRASGEPTLKMLAKQSLHPPIIVVALNGGIPDEAFAEAETVIRGIDEGSIQRGVMAALRIPALQMVETTTESAAIGTPEAHLEEIQTLFALGRSLTEVLNLSEVLNRIVEAARRLTFAEEGMILLPDGDSGQLMLRAKVGIDVEVARNFRVKTQDTLAGTVFSAGQPLLIGEQGPQKVKTEYFVNSLLYVPILLKGRPIGVLGVNNKNKHDVFTSRHQELLLNLASYAAIAIENARIHEETLKQARELKALVDASQVINSSVALYETLPNICEQLIQALSVNRSEIFEWDRDSNTVRSMARCYRTVWRAGHEPLIDLSRRPALRSALDDDRPVLVRRNATSVMGEGDNLKRLGAGAILALPVSANKEIIGAVLLYYIRPPSKPPSNEVLQRAQRIALQGLAQLTETREHHNMQSAFKLGEELNKVLDADWADWTLLSQDGQSLAVRMAYGRGVWVNPPYAALDLSQYPSLLDVLEKQIAVHYQASDGDTLPFGVRELLSHARSRAILAVPLVNRGQTQGLVLFGNSDQSIPFTAHQIDLARAIVGQSATALANAHLVTDLESSLRDLREAQGRLIQTARLSAMGELAAAVAHQVNNPLTTIVLDTELMLLNESQESPRYESLMAIVRAGKKAAGVVRRLLAAARPTDPEARMELVDVVMTVEDVISLVKSHIERDHVRLTALTPKEPLPRVEATPGQLDDVWLNLLLNAHDAVQGRDNANMGIEVIYPTPDDKIEVLVWDNGPGIPEDIMTEIFKPFFTTKPIGEGTGLGLHICRQVVERVGGSISVDSSPDEGTRFLVRLPVKRGD
jgi:signal transduction histidine kinase/CheY-like chemotaxis protein